MKEVWEESRENGAQRKKGETQDKQSQEQGRQSSILNFSHFARLSLLSVRESLQFLYFFPTLSLTEKTPIFWLFLPVYNLWFFSWLSTCHSSNSKVRPRTFLRKTTTQGQNTHCDFKHFTLHCLGRLRLEDQFAISFMSSTMQFMEWSSWDSNQVTLFYLG